MKGDTLTFTLPGIPIAKGRPRFYNGHAVTDPKTRSAEEGVLAAYLHAGGARRAPHSGPVAISIVATFIPATSWPKWKAGLAGTGDWPHTVRPDLDNVIKTVLDGLDGRAYLNDSQIVRLIACKQYGSAPSTMVTVTFEPTPERTSRWT